MNLRIPLLPSWVRWLFVISLAGFIFYTSIVTVPPETVIDRDKPDLIPLDKWRHFVAYGVFGYALAYATTDWELPVRQITVFVISITLLYGIGIEFGQSIIPDRYFSMGDAYANALGGILVLPWYLIRPHFEFVSPTSFAEWMADRV